MTRAHFRDNVLDQNGNIVSAASVRVEDPDTSDLITETMYAAASGATTVDNPLTSDTNGMVEFYLTQPKRVQLRTSKSGYPEATTLVDVVNADNLTGLPFSVVDYAADATGAVDSATAIGDAITAAGA